MLGLDAKAWNAGAFEAIAFITLLLNADWNFASDEASESKILAFAASVWKKVASPFSAFIALASAASAANDLASVAMTLLPEALAAACWKEATLPPNFANACAF